MNDLSQIRPSSPRPTVQARLSDGRFLEAPPGTRLDDILRTATRDGDDMPVAAIVDGQLSELSEPLDTDASVTPVTLRDSDGIRIYRRSLVFLLVTAAAEVFPEAHVVIDHAATTAGAYYCWVSGRGPFSRDELNRIEARMREIVGEDARITRAEVSLEEATEIFTQRGETDTARLLAHRTRPMLRLYELRGRRDYYQGYMVPSTGCLRWFALHAHPPGFMLQFPHQSHPAELDSVTPYPKLFAVFEEHGRWLERLGVRGVGALNDAIEAGRLPEISLVGEALHEGRIARIADDVARHRDRVKVVLIAGPSSSGKTTFSKRLAVQLLANGIRPVPVALDDYFLDRHKTPRDEHGEYDYESLRSLDLPLLNQQFATLLDGQAVRLPHYNFKTGLREQGLTVRLESDNVLIVEGIHGLNPELLPELPHERVYRIYVSALTQLNLDSQNRVSTTDCRLIRRVVRDARSRGYDASETLRRWHAVVRGEKRWIFPYQENGDAIFNSALAHELAVLRPLAEPLLLRVRPDTPAEYVEANRLLSFLMWVRPAPVDVVPTNSILREFVGGSVLETFKFVTGDGSAGRFA